MRARILPLLLISFSCFAGNTTANGQAADSEMTVQAKKETKHYGEKISPEGAVNPKKFLAMMEGKDSLQVKVKGDIMACCTKKGCWMDLDLENGTTMKVRFKDYGFFVPLDSEGKSTIIQGTAYIAESSVEEQKHYAEDAGKSQKEIDAITEPQMVYSFIADGVIITE